MNAARQVAGMLIVSQHLHHTVTLHQQGPVLSRGAVDQNMINHHATMAFLQHG
jgi:hypothetical protein